MALLQAHLLRALGSRSCLVFRPLSGTPRPRAKEEQVDTGPVKFTTSNAYRLGPQTFNHGKKGVSGISSLRTISKLTQDEAPWFQAPLISLSFVSLLVYFTALRYCQSYLV